MRYLRAAIAAFLLLLLVGGFPVLLAATVGDPLQGWDALRVGDRSADVYLDLLAALAWAAWAVFVWAVIGEIFTVAAGIRVPQPRGMLPGPQQLAHTLVTAVFLVLPSSLSTTGLVTHTAPAAASLHLAPAANTFGIGGPGVADQTHLPDASTATPAGTPAQRTGSVSAAAAGAHRDGPAHRGVSEVAESLAAPQFAAGAGAGIVAGVTLRELARLRARQWRHRRPGRAIPSLPPALVAIEKALIRGETVTEAERAQVLAARAITQDQPMPPARGSQPWDALCDAAGAPLPHLILARPGNTTSSLLDGENTSQAPDRQGSGHEQTVGRSRDLVLAAAATTAGDLDALSPPVPDQFHGLVEDSDPGLDQDLADWQAPHPYRPCLSVLGPVRVRASGKLPPERRARPAWHTEVLAYLVAHPRGVTPERFGTDLWPDDPDITTKPKVRQAVFIVRQWLGKNPTTGEYYLPEAKTPAGTSLYQVDGILTDIELFRRLRLRGITAGPQGIHDLEAALNLVTGPPFDPAQRRRDGYEWLTDTLLDTEYTAMIVDVAHLVATHHLSHGRPDLAARAAQVSLKTGRMDDIALLDLVAACDAQGHRAEADNWVEQILRANDTDVEEDLAPRTAEILRRRRWHLAS